MKKLPFSLAAMKLCSSMLRATPAVPTQTSFQAATQYIFGWKNSVAFPPKDCALLHVGFLSRYLSNRPKVSMVYRLINHAGCWKNTRRICKWRAAQASDLRILRRPERDRSNLPMTSAYDTGAVLYQLSSCLVYWVSFGSYFLETLFLPLFSTGFFVAFCYCLYKKRKLLRFASSFEVSERFYIFGLLTGLLGRSVWGNIVPEVPK